MEAVVEKAKAGQKHLSASEWRVLIEGWRSSGKTRDEWCREQGIYPSELDKWCASATRALIDPQDARATPQATRHDRTRINELERELLCKDCASAETAALLVLSKKVTEIFNRGGDA